MSKEFHRYEDDRNYLQSDNDWYYNNPRNNDRSFRNDKYDNKRHRHDDYRKYEDDHHLKPPRKSDYVSRYDIVDKKIDKRIREDDAMPYAEMKNNPKAINRFILKSSMEQLCLEFKKSPTCLLDFPEFDNVCLSTTISHFGAILRQNREVRPTPQAFYPVLRKLTVMIEARARDFCERQVNNIMTGMESIGNLIVGATDMFVHRVFDALILQLIKRPVLIQGMDEKHLYQACDSVAKIGIRNVQLFDLFSIHMLSSKKFLHSMGWKHLSEIVCIFASLDMRNDNLFSEIAEYFKERPKVLTSYPSALSALLHGMAKLNFYHAELFNLVALTLTDIMLMELAPRLVASISLSLATLQVNDENLFQRIARAAITNLSKYSCEELGNMLWSFARLGITNRKLFEGSQKFLKAVNKVSNVMKLMWSFACVGMLKDLEAFFSRLQVEEEKEKNDPEEIWELIVAWRILVDRSRLPPILQQSYDEAANCMEMKLKENSTGNNNNNEFQKEIVNELQKLGCVCQINYLTLEGLMVDILVITPGGNAVAVQMDGLFLSDRIDGKLRLKLVLMEKSMGKFCNVSGWKGLNYEERRTLLQAISEL